MIFLNSSRGRDATSVIYLKIQEWLFKERRKRLKVLKHELERIIKIKIGSS